MLKHPLADWLYRGFWTALDWIYPPVCVGCGEPGYRLCVNCLETIHFIKGNICKICGLPLEGEGDLCHGCRKVTPPFAGLRSLTRYEGVARDCVHALKYDNNQSLGEFFAQRLVALVLAAGWEIDLVLPVPLSPARMAERGYNQSALLARPVALRLGLPYQPFGLTRIRNTQSQVELTAMERQVNVAGAFEALPDIVDSKRVLLIDDVTTTGATIRECSLALKSAGAEVVYCLALSRPIHDDADMQIKTPSSII